MFWPQAATSLVVSKEDVQSISNFRVRAKEHPVQRLKTI